MFIFYHVVGHLSNNWLLCVFLCFKIKAISIDIIHIKENGNGIEIKVIIWYDCPNAGETTLMDMGKLITCFTINMYMNELY